MNEDELLYLLKHGRADDIRFIFKAVQEKSYPEEFPAFVYCKSFLEKVADIFGECCISILEKCASPWGDLCRPMEADILC